MSFQLVLNNSIQKRTFTKRMCGDYNSAIRLCIFYVAFERTLLGSLTLDIITEIVREDCRFHLNQTR